MKISMTAMNLAIAWKGGGQNRSRNIFLMGGRALAALDHLVYIYRQNSANNRWSRLFLLSADFVHRPAQAFSHRVEFIISANYQDYDFELDERTERSTIFRRVAFADSATIDINRRFSVVSDLSYQIEELGRLFWDTFEEERSDETMYYFAWLQFIYIPGRDWRLGAGYLWDSRRGIRFTDSDGGTDVFQDLKSYGPTALIDYQNSRGFFLNGHARFLRQLQLNEESRWITTGEIGGGYRW
jgi:hypothetical protein